MPIIPRRAKETCLNQTTSRLRAQLSKSGQSLVLDLQPFGHDSQFHYLLNFLPGVWKSSYDE
ncbi:hypothetical protein X777_06591 [Ooceraea biroi]|uniref:Uncharacterized protein n=1 Tax=Ooceraea biroi TaxID=2015173 RepID=A0A026WD54_OOCBI|nr:hypothetical protein X777_06591 [Ooceraea biroi]